MNTELYKSTFESVHASDELKGKVENMANNKKRIWNSTLKKVVSVAAAVAIAVATGNVVTYAATGNNLIDAISIKINGVTFSPDDKDSDFKLEKKTGEKGEIYYEGEYEKDNATLDVKLYEDDLDSENDWHISFSDTVGDEEDEMAVEIDSDKLKK